MHNQLDLCNLKLFRMKGVFHLCFYVFCLPYCAVGDYTLYQVTAYNKHERALLYFLHIRNPMITFLNGVTNEAAIPMDVIVKYEAVQTFENRLKSFDIQYIFVSEVTEKQLLNKNSVLSYNISSTFYDWESILKWIDKCQKETSLFKKAVIAKTFERRDIFFLKISKRRKKPIVFLVGGEDGMDWMSTALILNLFNDLLDSTSDVSFLLDDFDFYILPILNPDGYAYSQTQDRLWSKNRRTIYPQRKCPEGHYAAGINIARNWFLHKTARFIEEECYSINLGHKALSEEETVALSYVLNNLAMDMIAFINVKGFGQYITIPYGHTHNTSNNYNLMLEILISTCQRIQEEHGITYYLGTTANYFYNFSGNMADWVKLKLNTPLVYTIYLEDDTTVFPLSKHIIPLKKQLITTLKESLFITYDVYGPLFNCVPNFFSYDIVYVTFNICIFIYLMQ